MSVTASAFSMCAGWGFERYHEQLGYAAMLLAQDPTTRMAELRILQDWIEPAIRHKQLIFAFNELKRPVGFVTWATLAPDVERRLASDPLARLHESEWDEGERLWLMHFIAPFGDAPRMARFLKAHFFGAHRSALTYRWKARGVRVKIWQRGGEAAR